MEWSIDMLGEPGIIRVCVFGRVDLNRAAELLGEMWQTQLETSFHRVLWDLRAASVPEFSSAQLRGLTQLHTQERPDLPPARSALLVNGDLSFGLGRMLVAFLSETPVEVNVFRELDRAASWLRE